MAAWDTVELDSADEAGDEIEAEADEVAESAAEEAGEEAEPSPCCAAASLISAMVDNLSEAAFDAPWPQGLIDDDPGAPRAGT
jgi:hypothetical protein